MPSNSNFPASHLDSELGLIAQSYRAFSSPRPGRPTRLPRPSSAAVATSRYRSRLWSEPFNDIEAVSEWAGPRIGTWASPLTASMTKEETKARQRSNPEAQAIFFRRRHQLTSITNDPSDHSTTLLMGPPPHKLGQYEGRRLPSLRSNDVTLPPRCIGGRTSRPCHAAAALPYVPKS